MTKVYPTFALGGAPDEEFARCVTKHAQGTGRRAGPGHHTLGVCAQRRRKNVRTRPRKKRVVWWVDGWLIRWATVRMVGLLR